MHTAERVEARILDANNILIALPALAGETPYNDFFGSGATIDDPSSNLPDISGRTVYLCGDVSKVRGDDLSVAERVFVIRELSHGYEHGLASGWRPVDVGRVPVRVHGVGVYYRRFFDPGVDHFGRVRVEHAFQSLTESTKPGTALRTGIYLTPVERDGDDLHFRLLRCSTNLSGPTENFRETDARIVDALNREADHVFEGHAQLNHVLAQTYHNTPTAADQKQSKAKISAHADKTKDMPANGVMAFCTFYDRLDKLRSLAGDPFDRGANGISGLTKLHFRLKDSAADEVERGLPAQFTLTLYPDSVFFMPLSTNRLYTHEIRASMLDAALLPTRLGYVVRCSRTEAVHKDGQTFLKLDGKQVQLEEPTLVGMSELRRLYA